MNMSGRAANILQPDLYGDVSLERILLFDRIEIFPLMNYV